MADPVVLPLIDLPEWAENALQVVSFGNFTPRSAERRAIEAAARVGREAVDGGVAVVLDFQQDAPESQSDQGADAETASPGQPRKSPRLLSILQTVTKARAAGATAKAAAEAAAEAQLAAADDSDEVDEILRSRAAS